MPSSSNARFNPNNTTSSVNPAAFFLQQSINPNGGMHNNYSLEDFLNMQNN